jgi:UDP-N-acetylglucosamine 2-epimerase
VNIGSRQLGRARAANVIDVGYEGAEIAQGIRRAVSKEFATGLKDLANPYYLGGAAEVIVERLKSVELDERLLHKHFCDFETVQ